VKVELGERRGMARQRLYEARMIRNVLCVVDALDEPAPQTFLSALRHHLQLWQATLHVFYVEPDEFILPGRNGGTISDDAVETAEKYGIPYIDLSQTHLVPTLTKLLGEDFARMHSMLPLFLRGNSLYVATTDPMMLLTLTDRAYSGNVVMLSPKYRAVPIVADGGFIERAIDYMLDHEGFDSRRVEKALKTRFASLEGTNEIRIIVRRGNPIRKVLSAIEEYHIDLVAMPRKDQRNNQVLLNVIRNAACQVLIVPPS